MEKIKNLNIKISDGNYSSKYPKQSEFIDSGIPFIRANNMKNHTIIGKDMYYISEDKHTELKKGHLKTGDVLIVSRGSIGLTAIVPEEYDDANINAQIVLLRCDNKTINNKYLLWALNSINSKKQFKKMETGSTLKQLPVKKINEIEIQMYDYDKQLKIVSELDYLNNLIINREKSIEDLDELLKSKFKKMYDVDYPLIELNKIVDVRDGTHDSPKYLEESDYVLLTSKNIENGKFIYDEIKYISKEDFENINKRSKVEIGDILMPMIGTIGNPIIVSKFDYNFAIKNVALFKKSEKLEPEILCQFLKSEYFLNYSNSKNKGGIQKFLALKDIRNMPIKNIPIQQQREYLEFSKKINKLKENMYLDIQDFQELLNNKIKIYFN